MVQTSLIFLNENVNHYSDVRVTMDGLYEKALKLRNDKTEAKKSIYEKLNYTEQRLLLLTQQMKEKIQQMVSETEEKVSVSLRDACKICDCALNPNVYRRSRRH